MPSVPILIALLALTPLYGQSSAPVERARSPQSSDFEPPQRVIAGGQMIAIKDHGPICPTMADVNGDGRLDLVVGQRRNGWVRVYPRLADGQFGPHQLFEAANGAVLSIPGGT